MHVRVNAAMSVDGKLSSRERTQVEISGTDDFDRVDALRADSDAVMVGVGTVLADDPSLTVDRERRRSERKAAGDPPNPARVVVDSQIRTPPDATILDDRAETYLLVSDRAPAARVSRMEDLGATVIRAGTDRVNLEAGLSELDDHGIDQLLVEGGGELIFSLFAAELVDELSVFVGSMLVGGQGAPTLADGEGFADEFPRLDLASVERIDDGVLLSYDVPNGMK
jgi:2,5-diamino-6-(ribosylamino)-4(3H)-pyrimidinone 5'-phosphate reductase